MRGTVAGEPASERVFLIVGARRRARLRLQGSFFVIGRGEPVPVFQDDPQLSREHATVVSTPAGVRVKDLGSRNGLFVNGKKLARWAEVTLAEGDVVLAGATEVRLLTAKDAEAPHDGDDLRVDKDGVIRALRLVSRAAKPTAGAPAKDAPAKERETDDAQEMILDPGSADDLSAEDDPLRTADALDDDDHDGTGALVAPELPPDDDLEGEVTSELDVPELDVSTPASRPLPLEPPGLGDAPTADGRATTPQSMPAVPAEPTSLELPPAGEDDRALE
jgi:hypothetical protein